eukprot:s1758_g6.t1
MAGGDISQPCVPAARCPRGAVKDASPPKTPPKGPKGPKGRAERLACGLPAYINRPLELVDAPRAIPQVDEPWRPRAPALRPKPKHAAPGAFEVPPELLSYPARSELVVGIVQDGLNRWLNNISNEISHEDRDIGPVYIDPLDLQILRDRQTSGAKI